MKAPGTFLARNCSEKNIFAVILRSYGQCFAQNWLNLRAPSFPSLWTISLIKGKNLHTCQVFSVCFKLYILLVTRLLATITNIWEGF